MRHGLFFCTSTSTAFLLRFHCLSLALPLPFSCASTAFLLCFYGLSLARPRPFSCASTAVFSKNAHLLAILQGSEQQGSVSSANAAALMDDDEADLDLESTQDFTAAEAERAAAVINALLKHLCSSTFPSFVFKSGSIQAERATAAAAALGEPRSLGQQPNLVQKTAAVSRSPWRKHGLSSKALALISSGGGLIRRSHRRCRWPRRRRRLWRRWAVAGPVRHCLCLLCVSTAVTAKTPPLPLRFSPAAAIGRWFWKGDKDGSIQVIL